MNLSAIDKVTKGNVKTTGVSPFLELEIDKVYANPNQPRKDFKDLEDLAASIKINGLIQPIAVVSDGAGKYMIISGERRFRASLLNEARTIKAHVIKADSKQIKELALVENVQRNDLTDFEIAKYISILWDSGEYKKKSDLAAAIGKKPSFISKAFGCLKLDKAILQDLEESQNNVPLTVLEEISRIKDKDTQKEVYDKYVAGEIVRKDIQIFKNPIACSYVEEISPGKEKAQKIVCYGVGTENEIGTYISINFGDLEATLLVVPTFKDLIKKSIQNNYKITIEEISND